MKLGISSSGKDADSMLDMRFGRCGYFIIHDTVTKTNTFIENSAKTASGGAGTSASQEMINQDVEVVITGNMGPNAFNVCSNSDIKVYRCASMPISSAIQLFLESKLQPITQAGPAHAGMKPGL